MDVNSLKLNFKLFKTKLELANYRLQEQNLLLSYLLYGKEAGIFFLLALWAAMAIIADSYLTYVIITHSGIELNYITNAIIKQSGLANYYYSQLHLAEIILIAVVTYVAIIYFTVAVDDIELQNQRSVELIRKVSSLIYYSLVWIIAVRGFCAIWNVVMLCLS